MLHLSKLSLPLLLLASILISAAVAYNTTSCTEGCTDSDHQFSKCDSGHDGETLEKCVCMYDGSFDIPLRWLGACAVCNEAGLGGQSLARYQEFDYICSVYQADGAASASEVYSNMPTAILLSSWSSHLYPELQTVFGATSVTGVLTSASLTAISGTTVAVSTTTAASVRSTHTGSHATSTTSGTNSGSSTSTAASTTSTSGSTASTAASSSTSSPSSSSSASVIRSYGYANLFALLACSFALLSLGMIF